MKTFDLKSLEKRFWSDRMDEGISLMRPFDRLMSYVFLLSLVASVCCISLGLYNGFPLRTQMLWLTVPLIAVGALFMLRTNYIVAIVLYAVTAVSYFLLSGYFAVVASVLLAVPGIAAISCVFQRRTLFATLRNAESVNMRKKPSFREHLVRFVFDAPACVDLRELTVKRPVRHGAPWKEFIEISVLGLMIGTIVWAFMTLLIRASSLDTSYFIVAALVAPFIIVPWTIYRSLDAGLDANAGSYRMYGGIRNTVLRMAVPMLALCIVLICVFDRYIPGRIASMAVFLVSAFLLTLVTSFAYQSMIESSVVNDTMSKWKLHRPTELRSRADGEKEESVPGTPSRDR